MSFLQETILVRCTHGVNYAAFDLAIHSDLR